MNDPFKPHTPKTKEIPTGPIDTHGLRIDFGKHNGERWTRVPVDYIRYLINSMEDCYVRRVAEAELERRGDTMPRNTVVSNHAIDKASLRALRAWQKDAKDSEGLYSWLTRISDEILEKMPGVQRVNYKGLILVFAHGNHFATLKTVMRDKYYG